MLEKSKVRVKPTREDIVHTDHRQLAAIKGHKNYYVNLLSGKITYKKSGLWLRTGQTSIMAAQKFVEEQMLLRKGSTKSQAKRKMTGEINPTLESAWLELMESKLAESTPATMATYRKSWAVGFGPFWKDKRFSDVNEANIMRYKSWYLQRHPTRHFVKTLVHLRMLFKHMVQMKYLMAMPDTSALNSIQEATDKFSKRERVGRVLTSDEETALCESTKTYQSELSQDNTPASHRGMLAHRARLAVLLALKCGMRKMEILSLEWKHVDTSTRTAKVWSSKNKKWRDVPLSKELVDEIKIQAKVTDKSKFIFPMPTNADRHISGQILDKQWFYVKRAAGIKGRLRFHDLRHTFATRTAEMGMPPIVACEILDQNLKTYQQTYCKTSLASKREWMKKLAQGTEGETT